MKNLIKGLVAASINSSSSAANEPSAAKAMIVAMMHSEKRHTRRPCTHLLRFLCMFENFSLAVDAFKRVFESSPTYRQRPRMNGVFFNMQPRGKKLSSVKGQTKSFSLFPVICNVPRTSDRTAEGEGNLNSTPGFFMQPTYLPICCLRCSEGNSVLWVVWTAVHSPGVNFAHFLDICSQRPGACLTFKLVSPSNMTVEMKASTPPAGCNRIKSAGNAESSGTRTMSPTKISDQATSSKVSGWDEDDLQQRCLFSASSSRFRLMSSYKSFRAVQNSTAMNGKILLFQFFGDQGQTTRHAMKRK
mmetsp:Transcript_95334/g.199415  ORF Transcript_95334/g.199415 Transcript_95334/m.199415 type:complete len:302 (-) Transcript_95334:722-1627(-)